MPLADVRFLCEELDIDPEAVAGYARRAPTRHEHLDILRAAFGPRSFSCPHFAERSAWLVPVALATTDPAAVAAALTADLRRRGVAAPLRTTLMRLVDGAMLEAERHVARALTAGCRPQPWPAPTPCSTSRPGARSVTLAWTCDIAETTHTRAFAGLVERLETRRAIDLDASRVEGLHHERIARLVLEGTRLTAQHLRAPRPSAGAR